MRGRTCGCWEESEWSCRVATRALRLQSWCDEQEEGVHTLKGRESQSIHVVHFPQVSVCSDVKKKKKPQQALKGHSAVLFSLVLFSHLDLLLLLVSPHSGSVKLATNNTPTTHVLVYDC